jgi:hypothetical protein
MDPVATTSSWGRPTDLSLLQSRRELESERQRSALQPLDLCARLRTQRLGGTNLYAGTFLGNAFRSSDQGATWTAINSGLPLNQANVNALVTTASGTILAAP